MSVSVLQLQAHHPHEYAGLGLLNASPGIGDSNLRKRTTSFSSPPRKRLHRTETYVDLSFSVAPSAPAPPSTASTATSASASAPASSSTYTVPYTRTLRYYKEQKERRRALLRREPLVLSPPASSSSYTSSASTSGSTSGSAPISSTSQATTSQPTTPQPKPLAYRRVRTPPSPPDPGPPMRCLPPSPLVARRDVFQCALTPPPLLRAPMPSRPRTSSRSSSSSSSRRTSSPPLPTNSNSSPKSKPNARKGQLDLHRRAVTACMRASPAGAKILHMGARLAVGIMAATRELEAMCAPGSFDDGGDAEGDESEDEDENEDEAEAEAEECVDETKSVGADAEMDLDLDDLDIDAEGIDDDDMLSDEELAVSVAKPVGRVIVPAPAPRSPRPLARSAALASLESPALSLEVQQADVPMPAPDALSPPVTLSASWIVVGEAVTPVREAPREDWEMVEGA
ncbi:hypothetical protein B0H14DRAFT_2675224 [Mycena olivaceomarginata]|nr:hypothetical protein B0H14DRAFT_2675224 [Mycena olivaceomarginata]